LGKSRKRGRREKEEKRENLVAENWTFPAIFFIFDFSSFPHLLGLVLLLLLLLLPASSSTFFCSHLLFSLVVF